MAAKKRVEGKLRKKRDPNRMYFVDGQGRVCSVARKTTKKRTAKRKTAKKRTAKKKRSRR